MITIQNSIERDDILLGCVRAEGLSVQSLPPSFEEQLAKTLEHRQQPLSEKEDDVRKAVRNLLRNGRYKPTGRGKPASEYLVRTAQHEDYTFPRINAPVDICNYISLKTLLPISLWDIDRAETSRFRFRLGHAEEQYAFNNSGQRIRLADLIVGCRVQDNGEDGPIVNPVKDSMPTKTHDGTTRVAACVYGTLAAVSKLSMDALCDEFASLLAWCGEAVTVGYGVVGAGQELSF